MQLPRLVTKLEISKEEIPTQQGLKQPTMVSVLLIQWQGIRRPYLVAITLQMLSLIFYIHYKSTYYYSNFRYGGSLNMNNEVVKTLLYTSEDGEWP